MEIPGSEAKLKTEKGSEAGTGFAGPTWLAGVVATQPATESGEAAWLLPEVVRRAGDGKLQIAEHATRTGTRGGVALATGCDAAHQGQQARVPDPATYRF